MKTTPRSCLVIHLALALCSQITPAWAIDVTPTLDATALATALLAGGGTGIAPGSVSLNVSGMDDGVDLSAGVYTNASGTYGIGSGIMISTGGVANYGDGPNTVPNFTTAYGAPANPAQEALLDPITGGIFNHFDTTQIDVTFDMMPGFETVFFNVVFGSEEFDEFVGSEFIDGFGLYVNGTNVAFVDGLPVNINHPEFEFAAGTELNGVLDGATGAFGPFVHTFSAPAAPTGNTLTFIVADTSDADLDTTAYIAGLGGTPVPILSENPPDGSTFDFGDVAVSAAPLLPDAITLQNTGDPDSQLTVDS